MQLEEGSTG